MEKMAREMIRKDPALKTRFDRRKAENPEFASNPYQQLLWFYRLTPYYDQSVGLYPVGKIVEGNTLDTLKIIQ